METSTARPPLNAMRAIKQALDPINIMNQGKIFQWFGIRAWRHGPRTYNRRKIGPIRPFAQCGCCVDDEMAAESSRTDGRASTATAPANRLLRRTIPPAQGRRRTPA